MRNARILFMVLFAFACALMLSVLHTTAQQNRIVERQNLTEARVVWDAYLSEGEKAVLCNIYYTEEREIVLAHLKMGSTQLDESEAKTFYNVLNEEC